MYSYSHRARESDYEYRICCSWSRNSRYLLTASKDWNVVIWDLASDCSPVQRHTTVRFDAPVLSAHLHPRNSKIILAVLQTGEAYVADLRKDFRSQTELFDNQEESDEEGQQSSGKIRHAITTARFDPTGRYIFTGTSNGIILVFNTRTKTLIARHKLPSTSSIKGLDFALGGRRLVTNSSDRTLRQFNLPTYPGSSSEGEVMVQELKPQYTFNDPINKASWHGMSYSPRGEWLAGGASDSASHKIYIWDISHDGRLAITLDGGRDPLSSIHWHPLKSLIISTTKFGNILLWHHPNLERWGAFAGDFEEMDENIQYEEREDEFDIVCPAF
jgi:COMPASS component SWD1